MRKARFFCSVYSDHPHPPEFAVPFGPQIPPNFDLTCPISFTCETGIHVIAKICRVLKESSSV
jgi:hypothetical protein